MSKIGKTPVAIPAQVEVTLKDRTVHVKGPKGELSYTLLSWVEIDIQDNVVAVSIDSEEIKNLWGLTRTLIANMIYGVEHGYQKKLTVMWVGYGAKMQGSTLILQVGFSHPVSFEPPKNVSITIDKDPKGNAMIVVQGIDKQLVGETAAKIRDIKRPEPYKGKGIRYTDEIVKLKPGKAA